MIRRCRRLSLLLGLAACAARTPDVMPGGRTITGRVASAESEDAATSRTGGIVVFLEPLDATPMATVPGRTRRVVSRGDVFDPGLTVIAAEDSVVFVNEGRVIHELFTGGGQTSRFVLQPNDDYTPVAFSVGTHRFFCSLHPDEAFVVLVSPSAFYAVVDSARRYVMGGVPDGNYRLSIWTPEITSVIRTIQVGPNESNSQDVRLDTTSRPR